MGQVINDSAEVRQFARRVNDALREVRASRLALDNAFTEVRRSWRDARAEDAERRINVDRCALHRFNAHGSLRLNFSRGA